VASIIAAFAPIWLIAGAGWVSARFNVVEDNAQRALTGFAFHIAMPAVLFGNLSHARLDRVPVRPLAALVIGTVVVGGLAMAIAHWYFHDDPPARSMTAMAAAYLNSGNLGIPVAVHVLDDTFMIAAVVMFQTMLVTPLFLLSMDATTGDHRGSRWKLLLAPLRNPIVLASAAGLTVNACGIVIPDALLDPLKVLGAAAVPAALFALGMSLRLPAEALPAGHRRQVLLWSAMKIVLHPLLAFLAGRYLLHIDGTGLFAVVLIAALPTAQMVFVYADRYQSKVDVARDVVMLSSLASMATLTGIALVFHAG
jgi:malonate transporter